MLLRLLTFLLFLVVAFAPTKTHGHNITHILAGHPQFSTFNQYLTRTHLATEINRRLTITVLALDNSAMSQLLSKHMSIFTLKNVLSLHILADYFGPKKLHQISRRSTLVASLFQATGAAPGTTGYVNITNLRGGRVGFGSEDNGGVLPARFVRSIIDVRYKLSVIQISTAVASPEAEAPAPPPPVFNLTEIMTEKGGCGMFARFASADNHVWSTFNSCVTAAGLTIFCPLDSAMIKFLPHWKKMKTHEKTNLLLYHALDIFSSQQQLMAGSGHQHTIAGIGTSMYNFTVEEDKGTSRKVNILTKINTATITSIANDRQPLAIYVVDKVLKPRELFKVADDEKADAPAPTPHGKKKKKSSAHSSTSKDDYDYDDDMSDDEKASATRVVGLWWPIIAVATVSGLALF